MNGTEVTVPEGGKITVTLEYTFISGKSESEDYKTQHITVVIPAGKTLSEVLSESKVDFETEGTEVYTVTIVGVEETGSKKVFENIVIGDVNGDNKSVTDTIKDGITFGTPENAYVDEDNFYTNKNDGTNSTTKNSNINDGVKSLGFIVPTNYESVVGEYKVNFVGLPTLGGVSELKSNGQPIIMTGEGTNTIVGKVGSTKVFDIVLNKNGTYTYKQYENIDHPKAGNANDDYENVNTNDNIDLNFQFNITTTSKNGQTVTSPTQDFKVTVNDSTPDAKDRVETVNEDGTLTIVLSDESFKDGKIKINNGKDGYQTIAKDGTVKIYEGEKEVGTLTNKGNGTLTFKPVADYSKYTDDNLPNFKYQVSDTDGDYAEATISIKVKPVVDGVTITASNVTTYEDNSNTQEGQNSVSLGLKQPTILDNIDKNDNAAGDHGERVDYIILNFTNGANVKGAILEKEDGTNILNIAKNNDTVKVVIVKDGAVDTDFHHSGIALNQTGVVYLTKAEYESLKIKHAEDNDTDIQIKISTKTYEVDDDGKALTTSQASGQGKTNSATMTVIIKPVTDDIELKWDNNKVGQDKIGTISADKKTFTFNNIKEDESIDLKNLLSNTSGALNGTGGTKGDLDGSEHRTYTISGVPAGTIVTLDGQTAVANAQGIATLVLTNANNMKLDHDSFTMKFPNGWSGGTVEGKITLSVIDKGVEAGQTDQTDYGFKDSNGNSLLGVKQAEVNFKVNVEPVADDATIQVGQPVGNEDAGRDGGNTVAKDGTITNPENGIPLNIKVTSTDKDGSETFEVTIKDTPKGGALYVQDPVTKEYVLIVYDESGNATKDTSFGGSNTPNVTIDSDNNVVIKNLSNEVQPDVKFIPPHNAHGDFKLNVEAVTVDKVEIDGVVEEHRQPVASQKEIVVIVKDVADSVVGNDYNEVELVLADKTIKKYNAVAEEDKAINLKDIFENSSALKSYDDASEDLTIVIKDLPTGVTIEGNNVNYVNGQYIFKASDINGITIKTPANYSGELPFTIEYITTEVGKDKPSKTFDSKSTEDNVTIFVKPTVDAGFKSETIKLEDGGIGETKQDGVEVKDGFSYYKLDLGIAYKNEDEDETLESVKLDKPVDGDFKLFIKNSDDSFTAITDFSKTYTAEEIKNIYVQAPENKHGDFTITGSYTAKDSQNGVGNNVNYEAVKTENFTHTLTITPVTDTPTIEVEDGTKTNIEVPAGKDLEIKIPVKVTSDDKDGSENITKIVISGVPQGVTIALAEAETDGKITISEHNGIYTIVGQNGYKLNSVDFKDIVFNVGANANFEHRNITITAYTKDAEGSNEEKTSITITLDKTHTGNGGGELPKVNIVPADKFTTEEEKAFNFLNIFKVKAEKDGRVELNFKIDVGSNATIEGLDRYKQADGSYTITGNSADIESVLTGLKITPNKDFNDNFGDLDIKVTIGGDETSVKVGVTPVTDPMTVEITPNGSTTINENGEFKFDIKLTNNSDKEFTNINDFYIELNENFEAGEDAKGELYLGNTKLELVDGKYKLPSDYKLGDSLNLTYKSGENRNGTVEIKVVAVNQETGAEYELTSQGSTIITVKPTVSSKIEAEKVDDGIEDDKMASVQLNVTKADPSETFESVIVKVATGVAVYYNSGNSIGMNLGNGSWLIPVNSDGTLPEIFFKGKEHFGGEVEYTAIINAKDGTAKVETTLNGSVYINEVADGVTIDPTKTGIDKNAFEWTTLNLNANMLDVDGSEKMYFTLEGLNSSAQFRLKDGSVVDSTYDEGSKKWTIEGVEYKDINNIQITHDKSVSGVKVEAWTVDGNNVSTSEKVEGVFDLKFENEAVQNGVLKLGQDINIDFSNIPSADKQGQNITKIDLGEANGKNELKLTLDDILSFGKKEGNNINLEILGGNDDKVTLNTNGWNKTSTENNTFIYTKDNETVTIKVQQDIELSGL